MNEPVLTVIMSCYNQAEYLRPAIESVLMQKTDFPFRLLITDDCSTKDESQSIIRGYMARYPDKIEALFSEANGRYLTNVLRAMACTKTEYFTLLDADDYWTDSGYLQSAVDYLGVHKDYTVYFRNVLCRREDGSEYLFLPEDPEIRDFSFEDYLSGHVLMPQTTGAVFRNVIFANGVPQIMHDVVGTVHERSFEGDVARFLMHLALGRARYEPVLSGVYRILSSGIWCRLPESEKHLIQAQSLADYCGYFKSRKLPFVIGARRELRAAMKCLVVELDAGSVPTETWYNYLESVIGFCGENRDVIAEFLHDDSNCRPEKMKDRVRMWLFARLKAKLEKKGLLL